MVSIPTRLALTLLACLVLPVVAQVAQTPSAAAPSFDCAKARGRIEKLICSDAGLASLDRQVADLFARAMTQAVDSGDTKRAQRRWLGDRDDCKDAPCVEQSYRQRIEALATQTGQFSRAQAAAVCEPLADPEARAKALANIQGAEDINNDGRTDRASRCAGGTANIPCVEYFDADDEPLPIATQGFEWMTYSAFGRAPFRAEGRTYTFYTLDDALEQPAYVSYITPSNREVRVCDFETKIASAVLEGGHEVCAAIEAGSEALETFEWTPLVDGSAYAVDRRDTRARALGKVDVDNDGLEEHLVEYAYSSGAGRGCEINYFELLTDDGKMRTINSNAAAVRALQGLGEQGAEGRSCGVIANRFVRFIDRIYFESNIGNVVGVPHELRILQGVAVAPVCTFEREVRSRVKTLY